MGPTVDTEKYRQEILANRDLYRKMYPAFLNDVFGKYASRIQREKFISKLAKKGHRYFNIFNIDKIRIRFEQKKEEITS